MANAVFDKQAQRLLGKRRRNRRWVPVVACLVLVVAVGTFYFMMQQGQAMSWRDMELDCPACAHVHTPECLDEEGGIICGYADYLVHEHVDGCYDKEGNLVCHLRQVKEHHHDETCYEKVAVYSACGLEESVGHVHGDSCYDTTLVCGLEEQEGHTHGTDCYNENDELICGMTETEGHTHTDACYEKELICGMEAGEGGHMHTDACAEEELVLLCQKPEISLHTHTDECYKFYDENGEELPLEEAIDREERFAKQVADGEKPEFELPVRVLSCGMLQTEKHEHGNECYKKIEEPESSEAVSSGLESSGLESSETESSALESSGLESSDLESSELESSDVESGLESSGLESSGLESSQPEEPDQETEAPEETESTAAYEDETLKVTASFAEELPEGAHLTVERIEDPEQLAKRQAKLKQTMDDGDYSLHALLQVGLQDEEGNPVEFESPASLTAEFFGEGAGVEGAKICAVAYRQAEPDPELETVPGMVLELEKTEVLDVRLAENGGTVTEIAEDTLLGFGSKAPVKVKAEDVDSPEEDQDQGDNLLHLDQSFSYKTDSMFELVFHIKGSAALAAVESPAEPQETPEPAPSEPVIQWGDGETESSQAEEDGLALMTLSDVFSGFESSMPELSSAAPEEDDAEPEENDKQDEEEPAPSAEPKKPSRKKGLGGATVSTGSVLPANTELIFEQILKFDVSQVGEGDPAYQSYADYVKVEEAEPDAELPPLEVLSYKLFYAGQELDLSGCEISVEVNATEELEALIAEMYPEDSEDENQAAMLVSVLGPADKAAPEESFVMYADAEAAQAARQQEEAAQALREVAAEGFDTTANSDVCVLDSKDLTRETTGALMSLRLQAPESVSGSQPAEAPSQPETAGTGAGDGEAEVGLMADETGEKFAGEADEEAADSAPSEGNLETFPGGEEEVRADSGESFDDEDSNFSRDTDDAQGGQQKKVVGTLALASNKDLNPTFHVEYYSYLNRVVRKTEEELIKSGYNKETSLHVINTEVKQKNGEVYKGSAAAGETDLPKNGNGKTVKPTKADIIYLPLTKEPGSNADYRIQVKNELMKIYESKECEFFTKPNLEYFDAVANSNPDQGDSYILRQVWVWDAGEHNNAPPPAPNNDNLNADGWKVYGETYKNISPSEGCAIPADKSEQCDKYLHFTNKNYEGDKEEGDIYIRITHQSTLRLVYEPVESKKTEEQKVVNADFYDYDIGEKGWKTENGVKVLNTKQQGINNPENYANAKNGDVKYAFGNGNTNTGTGLGDIQFKGNYINKGNGNSFYNCSFGIAQGLDEAGGLVFAGGIAGPDNFLKGKQTHGSTPLGGKLTFRRVGDMYSLTAAQVDDNDPETDLEKFSKFDGTVYGTQLPIYSNNFWPMDGTWEQDDKNHDFEFGLKANKEKRIFNDNVKNTLPTSDFDGDHNNYFGMHFSLTFDLVPEYVGPLEYLFFGDDDMWVFLTPVESSGPDYSQSRLICDIGGTHQSVGEFVNLWNHVKVKGADDNGNVYAEKQKYQLDFFYTERGASGSTCWMQFILPSVRAQETNLGVDSGNLRIQKLADSMIKKGGLEDDTPIDSFSTDETFMFKLKLTDENDNPLKNNHAYVKYAVVENGEDRKVEFVEDITEADFPTLSAEEKKNVLTGFMDMESLASDGVTFLLKSNQYIVIEGLPLGTKYVVEELKTVKSQFTIDTNNQNQVNILGEKPKNDYVTSWIKTKAVDPGDSMDFMDVETSEEGDKDPYKVEGSITYASPRDEKEDIQTVLFRNTVYAYELPKTGGGGTARYIWAGAGLCVAALALIYNYARKRGKEVVHKV